MSSYRNSSSAHRDIEQIANYIFELNPVAAYRFLDELDETWVMSSQCVER